MTGSLPLCPFARHLLRLLADANTVRIRRQPGTGLVTGAGG